MAKKAPTRTEAIELGPDKLISMSPGELVKHQRAVLTVIKDIRVEEAELLAQLQALRTELTQAVRCLDLTIPH